MALIWNNAYYGNTKIQTVNPIEKSKVEKYFNSQIESIEKLNSELHLCKDGSLLRIINKYETENAEVVEIHCEIKALEKSAGFSLRGIKHFLAFCQETKTEILILENGNKIPASEGALMSEFYSFYNSNKFRRIRHFLTNPKDRERMKKN